MTQTQNDIATLVELVNQLLLDGEPGNISVDPYSGYSGYRPQAVVDAMNETFGIGNWGFKELSSEVVSDEKTTMAISQVEAFLRDIEFRPAAWGQQKVTRGDIGDAKKGAQTDALKKALSYFSIGNRAYQGLLKETSGNGHGSGHGSQPAAQPRPQTVKNTLHDSPASSNQLAEITRLANALGKQVKRPATYKEAHDLEGELAREYNALSSAQAS